MYNNYTLLESPRLYLMNGSQISYDECEIVSGDYISILFYINDNSGVTPYSSFYIDNIIINLRV